MVSGSKGERELDNSRYYFKKITVTGSLLDHAFPSAVKQKFKNRSPRAGH